MVAWLLRSLLKMRLNATRLGSIASSRSFGDQLDDLAGQVPSLDLNFAQNKSLIDDYSGTTLVTHTRASSGTFVGSDGLLKTATTNLLLRSEEFDDASWTKTGGSITPNTITAPNSTFTADKLVEDTSTGSHRIHQQLTTVAGDITFSVYVKAAERDYLQIRFQEGGSFVSRAEYDLALGTAIAVFGSLPSIVNVGDGWYRISLTASSAGSATFQAQVWMADSPSSLSYTGDGTSGLYLWGAQLEQSTTVGEYIPTTSTINSAPRFDHNPTTGESLGLLVEEARTNLFVRSEEFDDATSWAKASASITTNTTTAPDGTITADTYSGTGASGVRQSLTLTSGTVYTLSFYVKSAGLGNNGFRLVIDGAQSSSNFTATSEWQRFTFTATSANTGARTCGIVRNTSADNVDVLIWGAQLEAGDFATSYIPTVAATVTRAADVASITGSNFSSWYRQDEGTVFVNGITPPNRADFPSLNTLHDGTSNNRLLQYVFTSGYFSAARVGSVPQGDNTAAVTPTDGSAYKVASAFAVNNSVTAVNGVTGSVDTLCLMPTALNTLAIGAEWNNANIVNSTIRRLTYWPTRLGNEVLQRITQ
jgi:hypothetical protein